MALAAMKQAAALAPAASKPEIDGLLEKLNASP